MGLSLALLLLGKPLRDALTMPYQRNKQVTNRGSAVNRKWQDMWDTQEEAHWHRIGMMVDKLDKKAHNISHLENGDTVRVQNQMSNHHNKWD